MRFRLVAALAVIACAIAAGCQFPRDPEGTLDRVTDGTLRVGVVDNPPWVRLGPGEPTGVEPELVRRSLDAEIEWVEGTETELVEAMRRYQLDLLIGGADDQLPLAAIVIAIDVVYEGQKYLRESVADLMDDRPKTHDEGEPHPLLDRMREELRATDWIAEGVVRLREAGHVLTGDIWVVPRDDGSLVERVEELTDRLHALDW